MMRHSQGCENLNFDLLASLLTIGINVMKVKDIKLIILSSMNPMLLLRVMPMASMILFDSQLTECVSWCQDTEGECSQVNHQDGSEEYWQFLLLLQIDEYDRGEKYCGSSKSRDEIFPSKEYGEEDSKESNEIFSCFAG